MLVDILRVISVLFFHCITLWQLSVSGKGKPHLAAWIAAFFVLGIVGLCIAILFGFSQTTTIVQYFLYLFATGALFVWSSEGSVKRSLFIFMTYVMLFMLAVSLAQLLADILFSGNEGWMLFIRSVLSVMIVFACRFFRRRFLDSSLEIEKGWVSLAVFSILACFSISTIAIVYVFMINDIFFEVAVLSSFTFFFVVSFLLAYKLIQIMNEKAEEDQMYMQQRLLEAELSAQNEFIQTAAELQEDIRRHNRIIFEYLERNDPDGAAEYLLGDERKIEETTFHFYTGNRTVDAILRMVERFCRENGIRFIVSASMPQFLNLSEPEIVIIFGNVLENAVRAAASCNDPFIEFTAKRKGRLILAEIRNSSSGKTSFENGLPISKNDMGGIGIRSAADVLGRHSGMIVCSQIDDVFYTRITIPF